MSSLEIAELTGKRHADVMRDIRVLLKQGVQERNFALSFTIRKLHNGGSKKDEFYNLTPKGCLILASGYNAVLREKIVNRLMELEGQRIEEEKNPELSANKFIKAYKKRGKSDAWISARFNGIQSRNHYTDTLKDHGVHGNGYALCTNAIYKPLFGCGAGKLRKNRNLPAKANTRDSMSLVELSATMLAEALADETITRDDAQGNKPCERASYIASSNVAKAIDKTRREGVA